MLGFKYEPALISEAIRQVLLALVLLGIWQATSEQMAGVTMAVSAVLALFTRQASTSQNTLSQAGLSQSIVAARAEDPTVKPLDPPSKD
jgi:hypothetical protein